MMAATALLATVLLWYAETVAFAWDEGFHLLAAQLIDHGQRLYIDFFFPQTPLNTYWNAAWMLVFGETWRTTHAVAALCTCTAAWMLARYLYTRAGAAAALCSLAVFGLNDLVVQFGGIGQAYGFCLLMLVCAFRCVIRAREEPGSLFAAGTGFFASAAAAASLLTAPAIPVFLLWLAFYTRNFWKLAIFLVAAVFPFLPLLAVGIQAPREVVFQIFKYNFSYRMVAWTHEALAENNAAVIQALIRSPDAIVLTALSIVCLSRRRWTPETVLCASLSAVMGLYIAAAHPTFARYFVFIVPFLTVLAIGGLQRLLPKRPALAAVLFTLLTLGALGRTLYNGRQSYGWKHIEEIARKVNEVTPPGAPVLADELVYFAARRTPPSGLEHQNSHKPLPLPPAFLKSLHVISQAELDNLTKAGKFSTVASCEDEDTVNELGLAKMYRHSADAGQCTVYWDLVRR